MRRALPLCLLLALSLSGCSYRSDFVVINESGAPVEVYYALKEGRRIREWGIVPAKKHLKELEDFDVQWRDLAEGQYLYDEKTGGVTIMLMPGEALRVANLNNYFDHGEDRDDSFNIESIRVTGAHGNVQYSGREARTQFAERRRQIFAITYR